MEEKTLGPAGALRRPRFDAADYLGAADLAAEQAWRRQRLRRHNRYLQGWGIVCGLLVVPARDPARPWGVIVCPGYALGPYGDEIIVGCAALVDLREWVWSRPSDREQIANVAIRYAEASGGPRSVSASACGCGDGTTRQATIAEQYRVDVLWAVPDLGKAPVVDICNDAPGCAPCPPTPYVMLAGVRLPGDEGTSVARTDIDLSVRQMA